MVSKKRLIAFIDSSKVSDVYKNALKRRAQGILPQEDGLFEENQVNLIFEGVSDLKDQFIAWSHSS